MPTLPLVQARSITVYFDNTVVFKDFNASVQPGGHLVLMGANGSGKSTLLKLFAGEIRLSQIPLEGADSNGTILWNFDGEKETSALTAKEHVRLVSPNQQNTYIRQGWRISGEEIIVSGFYNTPLLYSSPTEEEKNEAHTLAQQAGVTHLLPIPAPDMSQGQLRAMLILRAMAARPKLLLLDEPMEGLDATARALLTQLMRMAADRGSTLVVTAHRREDIPQWISDMYAITPHGLNPIPHFPQQHGSRGQQGEPQQAILHNSHLFDKLFPPLTTSPPADSKTPLPTEPTQASSSPALASHAVTSHAVAPSDPSLANPSLAEPSLTGPSSFDLPASSSANPPLVALENVEVYIDRSLVLEDINWRISEGEHWLVLGENGSGKSTLLRLLHGEEFAAWGGSLRWFGQSSIPLAQLQKRVGYVSDRLHSLYTYNMTARDVVLSGADGSIGIYRDLTPEEHKRAEQLIDYFAITPFAHTLFHSLSSGQGRRVLLARALVGAPKILLLDEPFSGLDTPNRALWLHTLTLLAQRGVSIVFVSHHTDEHAEFFTHQLTLAGGRIVETKAL